MNIRLSLPQVTNLLDWPAAALALMIEPAAAAGAQLIELTPSPWAWKI